MASHVKPKPNATALYLYGITRKKVSLAAGVLGVDPSSRVEPIECEGLVCWISRVDKSAFADDLPSRLENLDWLAETSMRHQQVASAIAQHTDILPARLGTVFLSESSLEADVRRNKRVLQEDFVRVKDSEEWGVKVFAATAKAGSLPEPMKSGRDYLKAKADMLRRPAASETDSEIKKFAEALSRIAVRTADGGPISAAQRGLKWQMSLLLKRADRKKLDSLLKKFAEDWAEVRKIEVTGPWPPYSFVTRAHAGSRGNG
jgi:gas vesicle protein GvpL/GvpF